MEKYGGWYFIEGKLKGQSSKGIGLETYHKKHQYTNGESLHDITKEPTRLEEKDLDHEIMKTLSKEVVRLSKGTREERGLSLLLPTEWEVCNDCIRIDITIKLAL
jgi:hypothetical protein